MALMSAILTAAGESTRMGRLKPLLSWHGVTQVQYQIAGLLGAGLAGVGAYLVSTSEGSSRVEICTLCSEPPVSQARLQLTGRQGAGIASLAAGAGLLAYAAF